MSNMRMVLQMLSESGCLYAKASGEFSLGEAESTFLEVVEEMERCKAGKVLLDGRAVNGDPKTVERFYYGEFAAGAVAEYAVRNGCAPPEFAYVLHVPILDPNRFGETVAANRGMRLKVFDDLELARDWLGIGPASAPHPGEVRE